MTELIKAGKADAGVISELAQKIWPISYSEMLTPEQISNMLEKIYSAPELVQQMRDGQEFFLINDGADAVGYFSLIPDGETLWLKKLYVLPQLQRGGYGAKVLEFVLQNYKGFKVLSLYVNRENQRAQNFYRKHGFTVTEEVPVKMGDYDFVDFIMSRATTTD